MRVLMFIANGTEDSEFVTTRDLLKRASIDVTVASIENEVVELSHGLKCFADTTIDKIMGDFDGIVLPGGKIGVNTMKNCDKLLKMVENYFNSDKLVAAICAAPTVLSKAGILKNKEYTVYDGFEKEIIDGRYKKEGVVRSENVITGRSMNFSPEFAFEIIDYLLDKESVLKVMKGILKVE